MYKLNYFNFKEKDGKYLITNDSGKYSFLTKKLFNKLIQKKELDDTTMKELMEKGFILLGIQMPQRKRRLLDAI